jgi:hypothetical protein
MKCLWREKEIQSIPVIPRWSLPASYPPVDLALRTHWCVRLPLVGTRTYFRSSHMCIYHLRNFCDETCVKRIQSIPTIPRWSLPASYPRVDLALRTDWCVWLPWIIVGTRKYFRSFHMCIHHLWNLCHVRKKIQPIPIIPRWSLPAPARTHSLTHLSELALRTVWCARLPSLSAGAPKYFRSFRRHM